MDSGDEDEVCIGKRDWERMKNKMWKSGYRDGVTEGKEKALQLSFDNAYQIGFKYALRFGQLQGKIEATIALNPKTKFPELKTMMDDLKEYQVTFKESDFSTTSESEKYTKKLYQQWESQLTEFQQRFELILKSSESMNQ